jgi:hypothetical protein
MDGYEDMKRPDGFIGAAFKKYVGRSSGPAVNDGGASTSTSTSRITK